MPLYLALILTAMSFSARAQDSHAFVGPYGALRPFVSDGCSASADGIPSAPDLWVHCCYEHDLKYWVGGTSEQRLAADEALYECVAATGAVNDAKAMYLGVRIGGNPYLPTAWRWGYGWEKRRGYAPLTPLEEEAVHAFMPKQNKKQ